MKISEKRLYFSMVICYNTAVKSHGLAHPSCGKRNIKKWRRQHEEKNHRPRTGSRDGCVNAGPCILHWRDNTDPAGEGGTNAAKNGTLTVGFDAEFPPMGFKDDNGNYVGFDS